MHKIFANSLFIGKKLEKLPHCHSTNRVAAEMIERGEGVEGTLILTENQTSGKGQRGNRWESEPGKNLTFSVILTPKFLAIRDQFYLNMIISLAVRRTLTKELGEKIKVKWPNDVYVGDGKICGILVENSIRGHAIEHSIVGVGLNVNQKLFENDKATSMAELTLNNYKLDAVLEDLIHSIEQYYIRLRHGEWRNIKKEYLENLYWMNETHLFKTNEVFSGEIIGIDSLGKLIVRSGESETSFDFKEISFVK